MSLPFADSYERERERERDRERERKRGGWGGSRSSVIKHKNAILLSCNVCKGTSTQPSQ